jgi:hypothetical protein
MVASFNAFSDANPIFDLGHITAGQDLAPPAAAAAGAVTHKLINFFSTNQLVEAGVYAALDVHPTVTVALYATENPGDILEGLLVGLTLARTVYE